MGAAISIDSRAIDTLLAARTIWHAGRSAAIVSDGEPTGHAALDALLPQGGWPRGALTELLLPADGVGELDLLLPTLWAFEQCLRSGACGAVVGWPQQADPQALRRLQVAADSGDCLGFVLRDHKHAENPSPAALRLQYAADSGRWQVRKCRGGPAPALGFAQARH